MKLKIFNFDTELVLNKTKINIIEVHNTKLFRKIVESLKTQMNNEDPSEKIWIVDNDYKEINSSNIELIIDYFNILSSVRIINPIAKFIDLNLDKTKLNAIQHINIELNRLATDLFYDIDLDIEFKDSFSLKDLLNVFKIKIPDSLSILENLFTLIDYFSIFKSDNILFMANLKSFLSSEELQEYYQYCLVNQVHIVLLEGRASNKTLKLEQKIIIDQDYYDYYEEYH